jgi:2-desacetyl-2-hydroxyethyl bacteriochlorophyllide A dehydrogenase
MTLNQLLIFEEPYRIRIIAENPPKPGVNELLIRTITSSISTGTELLIYRGHWPADVPIDETITSLDGKFRYPLRYGYAAAGEVIDAGSDHLKSWIGKKVFSFQPHGSYFTAAPENISEIPATLSIEDAVFYPNMETAVNLLMDGRPIIGENVIVFGMGIVGLLTTALLLQYPLNSLIAVDPLENRQDTAKKLGVKNVINSVELRDIIQLDRSRNGNREGADLIFECSGSADALQEAIDTAGFNGRIVAGSWYGGKCVELDLGSRFHRQRLRLISSQVSSITPDLSSGWNHQRRACVAWKQIKNINPSRWITHRFPFAEAHQAYDLLDQNPDQCLQVLLTY